mmetsp:Transcript_30458/g.89043  ORF Transcript_30458/g.89043 Transcript_30458/m.89043 type:complete len:142 (+) Transcript_30458:176-601(+)
MYLSVDPHLLYIRDVRCLQRVAAVAAAASRSSSPLVCLFDPDANPSLFSWRRRIALRLSLFCILARSEVKRSKLSPPAHPPPHLRAIISARRQATDQWRHANSEVVEQKEGPMSMVVHNDGVIIFISLFGTISEVFDSSEI